MTDMKVTILFKDGTLREFLHIARVSNMGQSMKNDFLALWAIGEPRLPAHRFPLDTLSCVEVKEG